MNNPLEMAFSQFMQQMKGQNPTTILNNLVSSGRVTQAQLDQAQQQAKILEQQLSGIKGKFGF